MAGHEIDVKADVSRAHETFRINEAEMQRILTSGAGPVARDLVRRALKVESSAKQHASGRPGPNVVTGRLRGSITWRLGLDARGPYVDIGSAVEYSVYLELGTSRMPSYPFLRPALEAARNPF